MALISLFASQLGSASAPPPSPLLVGLVAFYNLEDANDSLGVRNLTNNGSTTFTLGKIINAGTFVSASSQYLSRAAQTQGFSTDFTVQAWIKQSTAAANKTILQIGNNGASPINFLKMESQYIYQAGSAGTDTITTTGITPTTSWLHQVITISGTTMTIYRNGVALTPVTLNQAFADSSRAFYIGGYSNSSPVPNFDGQIDAVGLWSRALTAAEVTSLYNSGNGIQYPF